MFKKVMAVLMLLSLFLYADNPLKGIVLSKAILKEQTVQNNLGQQVRTMVPVQQVTGGDILVYVSKIQSQSKVTKKNIVVTKPVPAGTVYLRSTATCEGSCEILFSIDGGQHFKRSEELYVVYGGKRRVAFGSEYTHVRYIFKSILPFTQLRMAFKAVVK